MTGYAKYKKIPAAKLSVLVTGLMILIGGSSPTRLTLWLEMALHFISIIS